MANPEGRHGASQVHCEIDGFAVALGPDQLRPSGAFVPSLSPPAIDAEIELTLRSPCGDAVLRALVVQVITREQAAQSGRTAGFGVLFLDLVDDQRAFIGLTLDALDRAARAEAEAQARGAAPVRPRQPRPRIPSSPLEPPVTTTRKRKLSAEGTATLQRLRSELEKLPTRSPFAVLGLESSADSESARNAFLAISKRCHPHVYARFDSAEINTAATDLFIAYKRAYSTVRATARSVAKQAAATAASAPPAIEPASVSTPAPAQLDPVAPCSEPGVMNGGAQAGGASPAPPRPSSPPPPSARALAQHLGQGFGGRVSLPAARGVARARTASAASATSLAPSGIAPALRGGATLARGASVASDRPQHAERRAADAEMALSAALKHLAGSRYALAERELEALCAASPDNRESQVWLHVCRARKLKAARRPDAALEQYRAVLALDPEHREASEHLGRGKKRGGLVGKWFSGDDE